MQARREVTVLRSCGGKCGETFLCVQLSAFVCVFWQRGRTLGQCSCPNRATGQQWGVTLRDGHWDMLKSTAMGSKVCICLCQVYTEVILFSLITVTSSLSDFREYDHISAIVQLVLCLYPSDDRWELIHVLLRC